MSRSIYIYTLAQSETWHRKLTDKKCFINSDKNSDYNGQYLSPEPICCHSQNNLTLNRVLAVSFQASTTYSYFSLYVQNSSWLFIDVAAIREEIILNDA